MAMQNALAHPAMPTPAPSRSVTLTLSVIGAAVVLALLLPWHIGAMPDRVDAPLTARPLPATADDESGTSVPSAAAVFAGRDVAPDAPSPPTF